MVVNKKRYTHKKRCALFYVPSTEDIPFTPPEIVSQIIYQMVNDVMEEQRWRDVIKVQFKFPCEEDYEKWQPNTNVYIDFLRKWYHSRSTRIKQVSLERVNQKDGRIFEIPDNTLPFEDHVMGEDYYLRFKETLSEMDMEILELRVRGYTYKEIAERLGYQNHSGVLKRIRAIKKTFLKYEEEHRL